jgi:chromosome partitioning protein
MRTIALMNQKGGVGKTTTTVNLGAALAEQGFRVCMIDLDPQAHLTINYGVEAPAEQVSLYNVLVDDAPLASAIHNAGERIDIVPSDIDLAAAEVELVSVIGRETLLKNAITAAKVDYDFMLFDCPPSLGILTINALSAADEVIIPMQPQFLALHGVARLLETVQLVNKRMNPRLKVSGIVLTMYDSQAKLSGEVVNELSTFIDSAAGKGLPWSETRIFNSRIRRNIKLAECPSFGQSILKYDSSSNGAGDYRALAIEVAAMAATTPVVTVNKQINPAELAAAKVETQPAEAELVQG